MVPSIEAPLTLLQEPVEVLLLDSIEAPQVSLRLVPEFLCSKSPVSVIESAALDVGDIEPLTFGSRISGFKICMMFS